MNIFWIIIIVIIAFIAIKSIIRALESPEKKVARKFMKRFRINRSLYCSSNEEALSRTVADLIFNERLRVSTGLPNEQYIDLVHDIREYVYQRLTSY